ncbi:MAG: 16S rRNA (adenine(1518)-N(6)/adenine(1519)-N(6))-dimethyltransferase RsmA [Holosporaceae bacterium]|jgi:16S rRNA (adenine1518-N6/adenine1519-N6)-dimethyltransferase|nr:16S rRNA (adenine(1518)-N(6)/adenine(1519)-N(6))-dimethyltransferase RsmA [Holosporaceae bacterium]
MENGIMYSAKEIFATHGHGVCRELGQHFIFDENINRKIVAAAGDVEGKTVVEVGPGPGGLTLEILKLSPRKLYLLEYDPNWAAVWRGLQSNFGDKLEVLEVDALRFDLYGLAPQLVISNLPYNISTQLLGRWLPRFDLCEKFLLMFQKEVADRLVALPASKSYGRLSVLVQWKSQVRKICDLEPGSFCPPPQVRSSLLRLLPYPRDQVECCDFFDGLSRMVSDIFAHRRKVAVKSMGKYFENPAKALSALGYAPSARAEEINVDDFLKMYQMHQKATTVDK